MFTQPFISGLFLLPLTPASLVADVLLIAILLTNSRVAWVRDRAVGD